MGPDVSLERDAIALTGAIARQTQELEYAKDRIHDLERRYARLQDRLDDRPPSEDAHHFLDLRSDATHNLATVVRHLLAGTGVYDFADLRDASHEAGILGENE